VWGAGKLKDNWLSWIKKLSLELEGPQKETGKKHQETKRPRVRKVGGGMVKKEGNKFLGGGGGLTKLSIKAPRGVVA